MLIRKFQFEQFEPCGDSRLLELYPWEEVIDTPFGAGWMHLEPGRASQSHQHHELETFIVVSGKGEMGVDEERVEVGPGDVVYMPPFHRHILRNVSETEDLLFLWLHWEDMSALAKPDLRSAVFSGLGTASSGRRKTLICTCPPTSNGELHLGHLAGPILSADILVRRLRMLGEEAYYILGTDDNQSWIAAKARQMGMSPDQTADHFAGKIARIVELGQLSVDVFFRPGETPGYTELILEMMEKLYRDGHLVARDRPALYCEGCDQYLFEPYVSGSCPHCGKPCAGNACEDCGRPVDSVELVDPICRGCSMPAHQRPLRRLYFPLEPHRQKLEDYCRAVTMSTQHRALLRTLLDGELPEVVATHPGSWGIPVPVAGFEGQTISAWIEMGPGYLAGSRLLSEKLGRSEGWHAFWSSDNVRVIQTFGFDNCWNHGLLYPALLMAWGPDIRPPEVFLSNCFYLLDHLKFSTTRNHAVWGLDFIERNSADTVRFYLARTCPEAERTNFSFSEFRTFVEEELRGRWQGWFRDLAARVDKVCHGKVPRAAEALTGNQQVFQKRIRGLMKEADAAYEAAALSPQRVTRIACEMVRLARNFGRAESSWTGVDSAREQHRTSIALELAAARALALVVAPVMPEFAGGLWRALGCEGAAEQQRWETEPRVVTAGRPVRGLGVDWFPPPQEASVGNEKRIMMEV